MGETEKTEKKRRQRNNMPPCPACSGQMRTMYHTEDNKFHMIPGFVFCPKCGTVNKVVVTAIPGG